MFNSNVYYKNIKLQKNISNICTTEYRYFLNKKNVLGIACGYKVKNGLRTKKLCIQVFVIEKTIKNNLLPNDIIPTTFKGIPTDVIKTNIFTACSLTKRVRPVLGGYSVGMYQDKQCIGTAGCLVTNGVSNFILSSNHTLAKLNAAPISTPIVQPAYKYGGCIPNDTIAKLHRYMPLRFIEGDVQPVNLSDCAIGLLQNTNILSSQIDFIGNVSCVKNPHLNAPVKKVGATTELTTGIIVSITGTITVAYSTGKRCLFTDQIFTTKMSEKGDSGAILVNNNNCAIGMLVSNNANISHFCPLTMVLDQLDVNLVT